MFKVGDKVKFKKSSINTGMSDATESDVFEVSESDHAHIQLRGVIHSLTGWWNVNHFEHAEESVMDNTDDAMNNSEEKEINWEIGQEVFCLLRGKGVVHQIYNTGMDWSEGVDVYFMNHGIIRYKFDGTIGTGFNRSLFFSEPKIEAEKFPPKKPFVPTLKEGDEVLIEGPRGGQIFRREVKEETEDKVICKYAGEFEKIGYKFTKLGEEIIFN